MAVRITTPVTIVTGFLGSGKTTLINRILRETHGHRIAVIENEYGAIGVDAEFLVDSGAETVIQLANGCVCCTVRGDLARALQQLVTASVNGGFEFDRVLIETTGLADPGPVIQTFLAETRLQAHFHLDGVVALVDAQHLHEHLARVEKRAQIAYADRLLLTKTDRCSALQASDAEAALGLLNGRAPIVACSLHDEPIAGLLEHLFDVRGYALDYVPKDEIERVARGVRLSASRGDGGRLRPVFDRHDHDVVSCVFRSAAPIDLDRLNRFLDDLTARYGGALWRCKGLVHAANRPQRLVVQGVQASIQIGGGALWRPFEPRHTTLVFIGQALDRDWIVEGLSACELRGAGVPA
ncbi:MAG: GTP-binding protein [Burkholderiaceae bacterium]|nr:GTP-binding protein [Burkholderiaceae bacterium]